MAELKQAFRPEFLNRLDDTIIFNPLGEEEVVDIVGLFFDEILSKVSERDITLELTKEAKTYIAKVGFDPVYGARPLKRALYEIVEDRLADLILSGEVKEGSSVVFDVVDDEIKVNVS
jgi:ATP-dependent Clp protease ATP-binding subunit ClpB